MKERLKRAGRGAVALFLSFALALALCQFKDLSAGAPAAWASSSANAQAVSAGGATFTSHAPQVKYNGDYVKVTTDQQQAIDDANYSSSLGSKAKKLGASAADASYNPWQDSNGKTLVDPVRDQGDSSCCWAFAATASAESGEVSSGHSSSITALSPEHLVNSTYNSQTFNWSYGQSGRANASDVGGNNYYAIAGLMKDHGFQTESNYPFPADAQNAVADFSTLSDSQINTQAYQLTSAYNLPDPLDSNGNLSSGNLTAIKQAILSHGQLTCSYYSTGGLASPNRNNPSGYQYVCYDPAHDQDYADHAVTIIGWNDNIPASYFHYDCTNLNTGAQMTWGESAPAGNGAFLVKNSWGGSWGNKVSGDNQDSAGYFWMSYYNPSLGDIFAYNVSGAHANGYAQTYDDLGYMGAYDETSSDVAYGANVYTSTKNTSLKAVGYWTTTANTKEQIRVYTNLKNGGSPTSGTLAYTSAWTPRTYSGYYTQAISTIGIAAGSRYSVVVSYNDLSSAYETDLPLEYNASSDGAAMGTMSIAAGQSMISDNMSTWQDCTIGNVQNDGFEQDTYGNLCMVAYTTTPSSIQVAPDLSKSANIRLSSTTETYTGRALYPAVSVSIDGVALTKGVDYTVAYANNIKIGTGTVYVSGIGQYGGKAALTFKIRQALKTGNLSYDKSDTYNKKAQSANVAYKKGISTTTAGKLTVYYDPYGSGGATTKLPTAANRYNIYIKTSGGTLYNPLPKTKLGVYTIYPHGVSSLKLSAGNNKLSVSWKDFTTSSANVSYYRVYYKQSGHGWAHKTYKGRSTHKVTLKLSNKKKYYVKVWVCHSASSGYVYTSSSTKSAKTK